MKQKPARGEVDDLAEARAAKAGGGSATARTFEGNECMSIEDADKAAIRQVLHAINNSLHVLGLQAELARLQMTNGDIPAASAAIEQVLRERSNCGQSTRSLQSLIHSL